MPWKPSEPGEIPTLGYHVIDWIESMLAMPGSHGQGFKPFLLTREQVDFTLALYAVDPRSLRRVVRRGVLSRPRGWGKSPFVSALAIAEGLADVVPDGWDSDGQPVGRPWSHTRTPLVQLAAASEKQTDNAWVPLLEMFNNDAPVWDHYPGLDPMGTFVNLPVGRIEPITSSSTSAKGNPPIAVFCDQTEQWTPSNGGVGLFAVIKSNLDKTGGLLVETPNAYTPGMSSVAESTARAYHDIAQGRNKKLSSGILYDHREAPDFDLADTGALREGLRFAYGCASDDPRGCVLHQPPCAPGWVGIERNIEAAYDTDTDEQLYRADKLNQITHATDSWISAPEWASRAASDKTVAARELITLGFDGSRGRAKGKPDATALIGCRVSDGHLFEIGVWEAGDYGWDEWAPPIVEIEAAIREAFSQYSVAAFYADPAKDWRSHVGAWEAAYGGRVSVRVRQDHPFEWWMTGGTASKVQIAIEALEGAIRNGDMTHDGGFALTRHVLNARRRFSHGKLKLGKANDYSPHKIDAAVAAVLAWQARLDALAAGVDHRRRAGGRVRRVGATRDFRR